VLPPDLGGKKSVQLVGGNPNPAPESSTKKKKQANREGGLQGGERTTPATARKKNKLSNNGSHQNQNNHKATWKRKHILNGEGRPVVSN